VSKIVHARLGYNARAQVVLMEQVVRGAQYGTDYTSLPTETYRALVKSFRETVARLEREASYHEQDGRPSVASQIFGWCAEAEAALALLREADTEEGA
jgi:hypothetical protein